MVVAAVTMVNAAVLEWWRLKVYHDQQGGGHGAIVIPRRLGPERSDHRRGKGAITIRRRSSRRSQPSSRNWPSTRVTVTRVVARAPAMS